MRQPACRSSHTTQPQEQIPIRYIKSIITIFRSWKSEDLVVELNTPRFLLQRHINLAYMPKPCAPPVHRKCRRTGGNSQSQSIRLEYRSQPAPRIQSAFPGL